MKSPVHQLARIAHRRIAILAALVFAVTLGERTARSAQILINPGDDWEKKALRARPGDEIILLPGRHRAASFDRLVGSPGAPIVIRGASKDKPAIISASLDGIRIKEAAYLVIRDLQIIGGSASGIWISGPAVRSAAPSASIEAEGAAEATAGTAPASRAKDLLIENVAISKVGPRGQRHGLFVAGFADVRITNLRVEGWGGSAIELVACEDVVITRCAFRGVKDHSQYCGIRARAGCDRVGISESRFENAGDIALSIGGKSNPEEFIPELTHDSANASVAEAARVSLEQSVIIGSLCPIAFIHATDCLIRSSTIYRPTRCVMALLSQSPDVRIKASARNIFGNNLITWKAGDISHLTEVDETVDATAFILEPNLWWSDDTAEQRGKLGALPGKPEQLQDQMFDVDPQFKDSLKPMNPAAKAYGAGS